MITARHSHPGWDSPILLAIAATRSSVPARDFYYNDLAQNGWVDAFRAVTPGATSVLAAGDAGAMIDPHYSSPYAIQASAGFEHAFAKTWRVNINYQHQQGVHQYRRYEYVAQDPTAAPNGTLPASAPDISVFRTDNRSAYDGVSIALNHSFSGRFEMTAHYTLANATTWGANVGELFDYVNGVSNVRNPFGTGDHGPSGEDVRHRFVLAGVLHLPGKFEVSTLSQLKAPGLTRWELPRTLTGMALPMTAPW